MKIERRVGEEKIREFAWMETSEWESYSPLDLAMASVRFQRKRKALDFG